MILGKEVSEGGMLMNSSRYQTWKLPLASIVLLCRSSKQICIGFFSTFLLAWKESSSFPFVGILDVTKDKVKVFGDGS